VENVAVALAALGEGWHNYHHVFPWDYKTGELGSYRTNITTAFIDFFAKLGWAYDSENLKFISTFVTKCWRSLFFPGKAASPSLIAKRAARCGDGSKIFSHENAHKDAVWGFGDKDIPVEELEELESMKN
jgi:stearoyl-CoA desaturase (Delta-9 desaturase)